MLAVNIEPAAPISPGFRTIDQSQERATSEAEATIK